MPFGALALLTAAALAANPVPQENALPGTTGWRTGDVRGDAIQGYASETSVAPGETVHFHVSTSPAELYHIHVYRLGWYGSAGGREVGCVPTDCGQVSSGKDYGTPSSGWLGAGWPVTDELKIPADWVSGYYLARFELRTGEQEGKAASALFVVRAPPERRSAVLVQVPVNTWQAYNPWGGKSLYDSNSDGGKATRVSFDRPLPLSYFQTWEWEIQLVRFLEREGYDVSYQTDVDTDRDPQSLLAHRLVIVDGHDEYWTSRTRDAFDAARDAGTNLAFFGANIGYWQIQYEDGARTIHAEKNPSDLFRALTPPRPECDLLGVQYEEGKRSPGDPPRDYTVVAPDDPWLRGTGLTVLPELVGPEWDTRSCNKLGSTVLFHWVGSPADADAVRYIAASGARVFSAGSLVLGWGLDDWIPPTRGILYPAIPGLQQFARTMLADLLRPAPPRGIAGAPGRGGAVLHVPRSGDPRVQAIEVFRGEHPVCRTAEGDCTDAPLPGHHTYTYTAVAVDEWGRSEPAQLRVVIPNRPPTVTLRRDRRTVIATGKDADGDALTYRWLLDGRRKAVTRRFIVVPAGRHTVAVEARDGHGGVGRARLLVATSASR